MHGPDGKVVLDPDQQVQGTLRTFFEIFRRTGSATGTVRSFRERGLLFPRRLTTGPRKGELVWGQLLHHRALRAIKNPRYAGAFAYGRTKTSKAGGHYVAKRLSREQWHTLILDAHSGFITWEEHEANLRQLRENAQANGADRRKSPPREGPALLQGLAVCGRCGQRMGVRYYVRRGELTPEYICQRQAVASAQPPCQRIVGGRLDDAVGQLLVQTVTPLALEVTLAVQDELHARADEADQLRLQQVDRARYEAELAQRRYLRVDPDNRLVADSLEADWNAKLRALTAAQDERLRQRDADRLLVDGDVRAQILGLASDFPRLWNDPRTPQRERKRMVRLLIEDVTLLRGDEVTAHIRFRGGTTQTLTLPRPLSAPLLRKTDPDVITEVDRLLDTHTEAEIATILNARGVVPRVAPEFTPVVVHHIRMTYGLRDRYTRLRREGLLTLDEVAKELGVCTATVKVWQRRGRLVSCPYNDKGQRLYAPPDERVQSLCQWCGTQIKLLAASKPTRPRKWCSSSCCAAYHSRQRSSRRVEAREAEEPITKPTKGEQSVA